MYSNIHCATITIKFVADQHQPLVPEQRHSVLASSKPESKKYQATYELEESLTTKVELPSPDGQQQSKPGNVFTIMECAPI